MNDTVIYETTHTGEVFEDRLNSPEKKDRIKQSNNMTFGNRSLGAFYHIYTRIYYYIFYISVRIYLTQASQAFKLDAAKLLGSGFLADKAAARVLNLCSYCRAMVFARAASGILGPRILSARLRPW
jgi:hypothetical protein